MNRGLLSLIEAEYERYKALGEGTFRQLSAEELVTDTAGANSIAMIVWHIAGNLESRFTDFLTTDGEKPWRNRDSEFEPRTPSPRRDRGEVGPGLAGCSLGRLQELTDDDLGRSVTIRGVSSGVDEALLRSVAHASHHVGQIVYLGKCFRGDSWESLSIPPGKSEEYNANPVFEKAGGHAKGLVVGSGIRRSRSPATDPR